MGNEEDILLFFPPCFYPHMPYSGLAILQAYLEKHGIAVHQIDLNVLAYHYFLSSNNLESALLRVKEIAGRTHSGSQIPRKLILTSSSAMQYAIDHSGKAIERIQGGNHSQLSITEAQRILDLSLDVVSDSYFPTELTFAELRMPYSFRSSREVCEATKDNSINMFIDFFRQRIPSILNSHRPTVAGVSVNVPDQIIPAFTLCRIIRELDQDIKIIIGGNIVTRLKDFFRSGNVLRPFYDYCIFGEGEHTLLKFLKVGDTSRDVREVEYQQEPGSIDPNLVPCPSFSDLPLGQYFDAKIILPILASRRCYWDKCLFCSISCGYSPGFRQSDAKKVVDDIELLHKRHNNRFFKLVDDATPPVLLGEIADEIIKRNLEVYWEAYTILEKQFADESFCRKLYSAGCRWLYFGLETADFELARKMNKRLANCPPEIILQTVNQAGICTHIWVIVGFPSDNSSSVDCTVKFIEKNREYIDSVEVNQFALTRGSPIMGGTTLNQYSLSPVISENEDMALTYDFKVEKGLSQDDAQRMTKDVRAYLERELGFANAVRSTKLLSGRFNSNQSNVQE